MTRRRHRSHTLEFKLAALARLDSASDVQALARELDIERTLLCRWQRSYVQAGESGLRSRGRPRPVLNLPLSVAERSAPGSASPSGSAALSDPAAPARQIAELERKIGQQQLELDFFRAALRHVGGPRR